MNVPCLRRRSQTSIYYICQGCQSFHEQPLGRVVENVHAKSGNVNLQYKTQGGPSTPSRCTECGSTLHVAGPMWSAPIHNKAFVGGVLEHLEENKDKYGTAQRMHGMLTLAHEVSICCHPQAMYTADHPTGAELAILLYTLQDRKLLPLRNTISRQHGFRPPPRRPRSLTQPRLRRLHQDICHTCTDPRHHACLDQGPPRQLQEGRGELADTYAPREGGRVHGQLCEASAQCDGCVECEGPAVPAKSVAELGAGSETAEEETRRR
jgi:hypothetical protein